MSFRPGSTLPRSVQVAGGLGVAGLAALVVVAPPAQADTPAATATTAPAGVAGSGTAAAPKAAKPAADVVTPDYGMNKIRVGVQQKDGDYYPAGTTTAGSTITINETGPASAFAKMLWGTECTTQAGTEAPGSTETLCLFTPRLVGVAAQRALARIHAPQAAVDRAMAKLAAAPPTGSPYYPVEPGDTVTFTQSTVEPNMVIDSTPQTFGPCVLPVPVLVAPVKGARTTAAADALPTCPTAQAPLDAAFTDPGLPPVAVDDAVTTPYETAAEIDALKNDTTHGAPASITAVTHPAHGTAKIHPVVGGKTPTEAITYTPATGFAGVDTFDYTLHTANGNSTASVTVTVTPPPPTAKDDSASTTSGQSVTVHVTTNDSANSDKAITLVSTTDPAHGSVRIDGADVVYTAGDNFVGTDTFDYTISTPFGTATATVTITVTAPLNIDPIASTGVPTSEMVGISLALLMAGGAAAHVGRRR